MTTVTLHHLTESFLLDPPVVATKRYGRGKVAVHWVDRSTWLDKGESPVTSYQCRGVPLTKEGTPSGGMDYRQVINDDQDRLVALIEELDA